MFHCLELEWLCALGPLRPSLSYPPEIMHRAMEGSEISCSHIWHNQHELHKEHLAHFLESRESLTEGVAHSRDCTAFVIPVLS